MAKRAQPRDRVGRAFAVPRDCHATHATGSRPATVTSGRTVHADVQSSLSALSLVARAAESRGVRGHADQSVAGFACRLRRRVLPCAIGSNGPPLSHHCWSSSAAVERSGTSRDASLRADAEAKARSDCFRHRPSRGERPGSAALVEPHGAEVQCPDAARGSTSWFTGRCDGEAVTTGPRGAERRAAPPCRSGPGRGTQLRLSAHPTRLQTL